MQILWRADPMACFACGIQIPLSVGSSSSLCRVQQRATFASIFIRHRLLFFIERIHRQRLQLHDGPLRRQFPQHCL